MILYDPLRQAPKKTESAQTGAPALLSRLEFDAIDVLPPLASECDDVGFCEVVNGDGLFVC